MVMKSSKINIDVIRTICFLYQKNIFRDKLIEMTSTIATLLPGPFRLLLYVFKTTI